jgi:bidirectional [NiFe] hydrogenase diaphorase subunit
MKTVTLTIDGKEIKAQEGENLLWVALDNGIYIPNLCAIREAKEPEAGCRLCFVEVQGKSRPVTACTEPVSQGMVVNTKAQAARRLAGTAFELLMSYHPVDCGQCAANRRCELQKIAAHLGLRLKPKRLRRLERKFPIDSSSPIFTYDPNKCVLCGKCVWVCRERLGLGMLGFAKRGFSRIVTTFGNKPMGESKCEGCGACIEVCPSGALVFKEGQGPSEPPISSKFKGTRK